MKPEASVMPERQAVTLEKRRVLTRVEVIELSVRQGGKCGCGCGGKLDALREGCVDEHVIPLALGGSNDLDNRELWRKPCSQKKTSERDAPAIAKAKRLTGETCSGPKKAIPVHVNAWGPKGVRKLPSRPFGKRQIQKAEASTGRALGREDGQLRDTPSSSPSPSKTKRD